MIITCFKYLHIYTVHEVDLCVYLFMYVFIYVFFCVYMFICRFAFVLPMLWILIEPLAMFMVA